MFPGDFDGIIAGAPGLDWSGRAAQAVRSRRRCRRKRRGVHAGEAAGAARRRAAGVRCPRRRERRPDRKSDALQVRSESRRVQAADGPDVPDARAGRHSAPLCTPPTIMAERANWPASPPGSELGWTDQGWSASARATGLDHYRFVVFKDPRGTSIGSTTPPTSRASTRVKARHQCQRSEPQGVLRSRRQAAAVSRLGRSPDFPAEQRHVFQARRCRARRAIENRRVVSPVHGARHGALRRRRRAERLRQGRPARSSGWRPARLPVRSSRRTRQRARSIARARCAHTRRSPSYKGSGSMDEAASFACR